MSRLTAAVLLGTVGGSLLGCAHTPAATVAGVREPAPTVTHKPPSPPTPIRRASRQRPAPIGPAAAWADTSAARAVAQCESGNDGSARSHTGKYRGKWQMDADFWATYGGLRYAPSPELATEAEQDQVAYRGWLARGWEPWTCARIVGVYR